MKQTYKIKIVKRGYVEVTVESDNATQEDVYKFVEEKLKTSKNVHWGDPSLSIVQILNDDKAEGPKSPQIRYNK